MSAKEAREKSAQGDTKLIEVEFKAIENSINAAIDDNRMHCLVFFDPHKKTRERLIALGYRVGATISDRDGLITSISW